MKQTTGVRGERRGQVLAGVVLIMMVLLILIPAMVQWVQIESKGSVSSQKTTRAFNLAEAAIERGYWKVKGSTASFNQASIGTVIPGYNFDVTYRDVVGGTYRIKVSSGGAGNNSVTIYGEGRDNSTAQVRSLVAVFKNQTIYSPLMATQRVNWGKGMCPMWGPIMSQSDINLQDDYVANWYFPRKFAKGVVNGTAANPRDTNGLTPPNTDNLEWWSDYKYVPDLPILDFATLRSSAAATGTLNVYGCAASATHLDTATWITVAGPAPWDLRGGCGNTGAHNLHFGASYNHWNGAKRVPNNSYIWYYDGDVILAGDAVVHGTYGAGLRGSLIVRGNLTLDTNGDYDYTGTVPANAWVEYGKLTRTTFDTAATLEYPADNGLHKSLPTWRFGTDSSCIPATGSCGWINTVGMRGFTYVGGNLTITQNGFMDFNGAVWVNGGVVATSASQSQFCGIYFDDQLVMPTLNVVLTQISWQETSPSKVAWP